jgi:hypothetical protein
MSHVLQTTALAFVLILVAARATGQEVVISCDPSLSWAYISEKHLVSPFVVLEGKTRTKQVIDTASLPITWEAEKLSPGSRGNVQSATCGPFTFILSSISVSSSDVASVFSVWEGNVRVLGPLTLGECELSGNAECPSKWVTSATLRWDEAAKFSPFSLQHSFQEFRVRPNKTMEPTR